MALSTENSLLVWQKAKVALEALGASPVEIAMFKALKERLAGVGGNPDLQLVFVSSTDVDDANGKVLADVPCKFYAGYFKKQNNATDCYLAILDDEADDASPVADVRAVVGLIDANERAAIVYPAGMNMAKGIVAKAYTEFDGTTDAADTTTPNGFVIISAA